MSGYNSNPMLFKQLVKIIWLSKKEGLTYSQIYERMNRERSLGTINSALTQVRINYWDKADNEIRVKGIYYYAVKYAKSFLIKGINPFDPHAFDEVDPRIINHTDPYHPVFLEKDPVLHIPRKTTLPSEVKEETQDTPPPPQPMQLPPIENADPFTVFEEEIMGAVTKLVTRIVEIRVKKKEQEIQEKLLEKDKRINHLTNELITLKGRGIGQSLREKLALEGI